MAHALARTGKNFSHFILSALDLLCKIKVKIKKKNRMPPRHLPLEVFNTHCLGEDPGADLELAGGIVYLIKGSHPLGMS